MTSHEVVTPVPGFRRDRVTGVQAFYKSMNKLDSGACRNDGKEAFGLRPLLLRGESLRVVFPAACGEFVIPAKAGIQKTRLDSVSSTE
jgi:hypothetical protein